MRVKRVLSALSRHLVAYSDLIGAAASEWRAGALRRVVYALTGLTLAIGAVVIASVWLLLTIWESPERHWIAAGLVIVLASGAALAVRAAGSSAPGPQQSRLKSEWREDLALLADVRRPPPDQAA